MTGPDALDVSLVDAELLAELHLVTELIIAVQTFDRPLDTAEIDEILHLSAEGTAGPVGDVGGARGEA